MNVLIIDCTDGTSELQEASAEEEAALVDRAVEPDGTPSVLTLADVAAALRDPLANLTASSASTTVRTAILNQRAALDALLELYR
jgi:hypothetical protein